MALSVNDRQLLLSSNVWSDGYLNRWPLRIVATAVINQGVFTYPLSQVTVITPSAGWITDTQPGMMYRITDTNGNHSTTGTLRKANTTTTIAVDAKFAGDPGRTQDIAVPLANNYLVYIYDYYPLWTIYSVIRNGIFYKNWDTLFTNQGTNPAPVCNIGKWRHALVESGGTAQLVFTARDSFDWTGSSLTYAWVIPSSGATLVAGVLTAPDITVEFSPGFYLIECTISNGTTSRRGIRPVWVNEPSGANAAYSELSAIEIVGDTQDLLGRSMSLVLHGDRTETDFQDGGAVMLSEYPQYGGISLSSGADSVDTYVGFIAGTTRVGTQHKNQLPVETMSPAKYLEMISCPTQAIYESATPSNWTEVFTDLATPSFCLWYIIHYHCPNALLMFDFIPLDDVSEPRKTRWNLTNSDHVTGIATEVGAAVAGSFGSASSGEFYLRRNPNVEGATFRAGMDTRMTLVSDHIVGEIRRLKSFRPTVGEYTAYAFRMDGVTLEPLKSIAGLTAQGQGATKTQGASLLVNSQTELNEMCGNLMAIENNPEQFRLTLNRAMDLFDPIKGRYDWVNLSIPAEYDPRRVGYVGRATVVGVDREWRRVKGRYNKYITVTVQPETSGEEGETIVIPKFDNTNETGIAWGFDTLGSDYTLDFQVTDGDLEWRPSSGSGWTSVGDITGDPGDPGDCPDCGEATTPDPVPEGDRPVGEDWGCVSSANSVEFVDELADTLVVAIDTATSAFNFQQQMRAVIQSVVTTGTTTNAYVKSLSDDWYGGDSTDITDAFTPTFFEELQDLIPCYLNTDGQVDDYFGLLDEINRSGTAWEITYDLFEFLGAGGIDSVAQLMGVSAATCTDLCGWVETFDFTIDDQGFATVEATDFEEGGTYSAAVGWIQTLPGILNTFCSISIAFGAETTLTSARAIYDFENSHQWSGAVPYQSIRIFPNNNHQDPGLIKLVDVLALSDDSGDDQKIGWSGSAAILATDWLEVQIHSGREFNATAESGSLTITSIRLTGTGDNPFS